MVAAVEQPGKAEITNLGHAQPGDQDVLRLDVAMDEPGIVGMRQGGADLFQEMDAFPGIEDAPPFDEVLQGSSINIFHDKSWRIDKVANGVNLDNVGMIEPGHGQRLRAQPPAKFLP